MTSVQVVAYAMLAVGVMVALGVTFTTARTVGELLVDRANDDRDLAFMPDGITTGTPFPDVNVLDVAGHPINLRAAGTLLLILVVVRNEERDLAELSQLPHLIPEGLHDSTVVSAWGDADLLRRLATDVAPIVVHHDADRWVATIVRTPYRPYLVVLHDGDVVASRGFGSAPELATVLSEFNSFEREPDSPVSTHDSQLVKGT